jgi:hypothetical protein
MYLSQCRSGSMMRIPPRSRSARTQAADELLCDSMPIDTARLPVPLRHQTMEGCPQDARLGFHLHIRPELACLDTSAQLPG